MLDFQASLDKFTATINASIEKYAQGFSEHMVYSDTDPEAYFKPVTVSTGKKNAKVWIHSGSSTSIYCFINMETGQIFKAAGINAPAKGARGNIFNPECYENQNLSGTGWLYR